MGVLKVPKRTSFLRSIWNRGIAPKPKGDIAKAPVAAVSSRSAKPKNDEKGAHQKGDSNLFKSKQINSNQPVEAAAPAKVVITQAQIKKLKRRVSIAYRRLRRVRKWAGKQKHPSYRKAARDVYQSLSRARKQIKGGHVQAAALNYLRATVLLGRLKTNRRVEQNLSTQVETGTSLISQRSSSTRIFHMVYDAPAAEQKNGNELLGDFRTKLARERKQLSKTGARMIYAEPKQYKRLARIYSHRAKRVAKLVHRYQLYKKICAGHKEVNLRLTGLAKSVGAGAQSPAWDSTFKALHGASLKLEGLATGVLSGRSSKEVAVELRTIERDYNKQELIARQLITAKAAKRFHKQLEALSQSAYSDPVKAAVQKEVFNNPRTKGVWRRLKVLGSRWGKLSAPDLLEYQVLYKEYNVRMQCIQFKLMHDRGAAHNNHFRYQIDKMGSELRGHYLAAKAILNGGSITPSAYRRLDRAFNKLGRMAYAAALMKAKARGKISHYNESPVLKREYKYLIDVGMGKVDGKDYEAVRARFIKRLNYLDKLDSLIIHARGAQGYHKNIHPLFLLTRGSGERSVGIKKRLGQISGQLEWLRSKALVERELTDVSDLKGIKDDPALKAAVKDIFAYNKVLQKTAEAGMFGIAVGIVAASGGAAGVAGGFVAGIFGTKLALLGTAAGFATNVVVFTATSRLLNKLILEQTPEHPFWVDLGINTVMLGGLAVVGRGVRAGMQLGRYGKQGAGLAKQAEKGIQLSRRHLDLLKEYKIFSNVAATAGEIGYLTLFSQLSGSGNSIQEDVKHNLAFIFGLRLAHRMLPMAKVQRATQRVAKRIGDKIKKQAVDESLDIPITFEEPMSAEEAKTDPAYARTESEIPSARSRRDSLPFDKTDPEIRSTRDPEEISTSNYKKPGQKGPNSDNAIDGPVYQGTKLPSNNALDPVSLIRFLETAVSAQHATPEGGVARVKSMRARRAELQTKYGKDVPVYEADAIEVTLKLWDKSSGVERAEVLAELGIKAPAENTPLAKKIAFARKLLDLSQKLNYKYSKSVSQRLVNQLLRIKTTEHALGLSAETLGARAESVAMEGGRVGNGVKVVGRRARKWAEQLTISEGLIFFDARSDNRILRKPNIVERGDVKLGDVLLVDKQPYKVDATADGFVVRQMALDPKGNVIAKEGSSPEAVRIPKGNTGMLSTPINGGSMELVSVRTGDRVRFILQNREAPHAASAHTNAGHQTAPVPSRKPVDFSMGSQVQTIHVEPGVGRAIRIRTSDPNRYLMIETYNGEVRCQLMYKGKPGGSGDSILMGLPLENGVEVQLNGMFIARSGKEVKVSYSGKNNPAVVLDGQNRSSSFKMPKQGQYTVDVEGNRYSVKRDSGGFWVGREGTKIAVNLMDGVPQHQKNLIFVRQGDKVKVEYTRSPVRVGRGRRGEAKKVEIPKGINGRPVDQANYREVQNAGQFKHGDILPGSAFVLGDARTYNRELLSVNTGKSSSLYKLRQAARRLAQSHQGTKKELVDKIADLVEQAYPSQKDNHKAAEAMTIGHFIVNGGCCRHRSAALQMALQSANSGLRQAGSLMRINSQYTRGRLGGAGNHAWVEVKLSRGNYVVDPNANNPKTGKKNRGFMEDSLQLKSKEGEIMFGAGYHLYIRGGYGTTVWRPKSLVK